MKYGEAKYTRHTTVMNRAGGGGASDGTSQLIRSVRRFHRSGIRGLLRSAVLTGTASLASLSLAAQATKERESAMSPTQDETFAISWVQSWNERDLEAVLSHYSDDVEFQSPLVAWVLNEPTGTVRGKKNLREYFQKVVATFPNVRIKLLGTYRGVNSRMVQFEATTGRKAVEVMELDGGGKVRRAITLGQP
jgi:ketosteroid isomerase-like protein